MDNLTIQVLAHSELSSAPPNPIGNVVHPKPVQEIITNFLKEVIRLATTAPQVPSLPGSTSHWKQAWYGAADEFTGRHLHQSQVTRSAQELRRYDGLQKYPYGPVQLRVIASTATILTWLIMAKIPPKEFYGR